MKTVGTAEYTLLDAIILFTEVVCFIILVSANYLSDR